jgi:predicted AlkP superfamily pyrophosphatase or phosphodiesterase
LRDFNRSPLVVVARDADHFGVRLIKYLLTFLAVVFMGAETWAAGRATHVVLMVWDGMRPDFVSDETTPTLAAMARQGVIFLHHHPAYPSMTEVNATALATGVYPQESGIIGNSEYRPGIDPLKPSAMDALDVVRQGDELTGKHYLAFPTVVEILQDHGLRTAVAGSKPVALLYDRAPRAPDSPGVDLFAESILPAGLGQSLTNLTGKCPPFWHNKIKRDEWTARALTGFFWQDEIPAFSVLWMAEPDFSQHKTGPGSKASLAAIKSSDRNLARMLDTLREKNALDSTDVIVVSDHGFSTIIEGIKIPAELKARGFRAYTKFPGGNRKNGDIMVVGNGGEVACYVTGHDPEVITQLVHFFQSRPYVGVVFSQKPVEGTFPLTAVKIDSAYAPDVAISMRWTPAQSKYGAPGMIFSDGGALGAGDGQHATLSATDMHNMCVAFGPDFVKGMSDSLPTGNVDIAPTILWLLGVEPKEKMSGRILSEALTQAGPEVKASAPQHREAAWKGRNFVWQQYLDTSEVNGVVYLDQGNGAQIHR